MDMSKPVFQKKHQLKIIRVLTETLRFRMDFIPFKFITYKSYPK